MNQKRVLITGANGFLGKHLVEQAPENIECLCPSSKELDLLDYCSVLKYLNSHQPDAIIHAAGFVGGVGLNKAYPGQMSVKNLRMGLNILEAASTIHSHTIIISTICVYPEDALVPIKEEEIWKGYPAIDTAPYGLAKRQLLSIAQSLHSEFKLPYSYVIPTNLYGPHDHFEEEKSHFIAALIKRIEDAKQKGLKELMVWGDGTPTRDLIYARDAAKAIWQVFDHGPLNDYVNLGSGKEITIKEYVEKLCHLMNFEGEIKWDITKPMGALRRGLSIEKINKLIGFSPATSMENGLRETIDWYKKNI